MNRHERRRQQAQLRAKKLPPARQDGRPLYYDVNLGDKVNCYHCEKAGIKGMTYGQNEGFIADPANSPDGSPDVFTVCRGHLPERAVIYNPTSNMCRNKSGTENWMEDNPDMSSTEKIAQKSGFDLPPS